MKNSKTKTVKYHKNVSDYITLEEFRQFLNKTIMPNEYYTQKNCNKKIELHLDHSYINDNEYYNLSRNIRQAIIWKSLGFSKEQFRINGSNELYMAVWSKLPVIDDLKATGRVYSAMWGYGQTQITTAKHYGRAFGLDVFLTGGFCGKPEILLKRISKSDTFKDGCIYFSPNTYTAEKIHETNTIAILYGN